MAGLIAKTVTATTRSTTPAACSASSTRRGRGTVARASSPLTCMKERGNGLGAGFAAYGLYPEFREHYAFHVMCRDEAHAQGTGRLSAPPLCRGARRADPPPHGGGHPRPAVVWRYFLFPLSAQMVGRSEEDYIVHQVMTINSSMEGAFVFSSGKNMGIFKGVGHPEQIAEFYRVEDYQAYMWTAHTRFPTNTPGWWGGAHPFGLLDWSVVHNGEISSYGINRRYLEMHGYLCTMRTDTEVIAYAADLLMRRHGLPAEMAAAVFAAPLWDEIERMPPGEEQRLLSRLAADLWPAPDERPVYHHPGAQRRDDGPGRPHPPAPAGGGHQGRHPLCLVRAVGHPPGRARVQIHLDARGRRAGHRAAGREPVPRFLLPDLCSGARGRKRSFAR